MSSWTALCGWNLLSSSTTMGALCLILGAGLTLIIMLGFRSLRRQSQSPPPKAAFTDPLPTVDSLRALWQFHRELRQPHSGILFL